MPTTPPPPHPELQQVEAAGAVLMSSMVTESILGGTLPPPHIFTWALDYVVEALIYSERSGADPQLMEGLAAQVDMYMLILERNKQLGLLQKVKDRLKARVLRLDPLFDATYGGKLSWV